MFSKDGEYVDWNQPILCDGPAEIWLNSIGKLPKTTIKKENYLKLTFT